MASDSERVVIRLLRVGTAAAALRAAAEQLRDDDVVDVPTWLERRAELLLAAAPGAGAERFLEPAAVTLRP